MFNDLYSQTVLNWHVTNTAFECWSQMTKVIERALNTFLTVAILSHAIYMRYKDFVLMLLCLFHLK